jgi:hypothetical protein
LNRFFLSKPNGDPQKYSTVQLASGSEIVDFITGPLEFQREGGQKQLGFFISIDPGHWPHVDPIRWKKGRYKFVMQVSALGVEEPGKLTLLVDWNGRKLVILSDADEILETAEVLNA